MHAHGTSHPVSAAPCCQTEQYAEDCAGSSSSDQACLSHVQKCKTLVCPYVAAARRRRHCAALPRLKLLTAVPRAARHCSCRRSCRPSLPATPTEDLGPLLVEGVNLLGRGCGLRSSEDQGRHGLGWRSSSAWKVAAPLPEQNFYLLGRGRSGRYLLLGGLYKACSSVAASASVHGRHTQTGRGAVAARRRCR